MSNCSGYPLSLIAQYTLAHMLGYNPEALEFRKIDRVYGKLQGVYETFKGTMRLTVRRRAGTLVVEYRDRLVTPSPHPQRPGSKPGLPRAVCRFSARTRTPHLPFGFPMLGASPFRAGGPRLQRVHRGSLPALAPSSSSILCVQTLNLFRL
jgi:hypothetical protein